MKITNLLTIAAVALSFNFDSKVESMQQSQRGFVGDAHTMVSNTLTGENLKKVLQVYGFVTGMSFGFALGIFIGMAIAGA